MLIAPEEAQRPAAFGTQTKREKGVRRYGGMEARPEYDIVVEAALEIRKDIPWYR